MRSWVSVTLVTVTGRELLIDKNGDLIRIVMAKLS